METEKDHNAKLLAHPLPNLRFAVYVPTLSEDVPVAIFQTFGSANRWAFETHGPAAIVNEIELFSDRMPVAEPQPARWRSDT